MISVVVLTKNEQKNIEACLKTLSWTDEVLVVDDYSTDKTHQIAQELGAKVYQRHLSNDFAAQRNFGLNKAKGNWVLFVDADERVSPQLAGEIKKKIKDVSFSGFWLKRNDFLWGKRLRYGETAKVKLIRLGKKGSGQWQRPVHETWQIKGRIGELKQSLTHYPHQTMTEFLSHVNFHSTLHAEALFQEGVKPNLFRIIFYPMAKFGQNWLVRLGFLDKMPGLIVALMMSLHSFLAQSKLYLKNRRLAP